MSDTPGGAPAHLALTAEKPFSFKAFFLQWEWILFAVFLLVNVVNAYLSPFYLDAANLVDITMSFLDKGFIVLPMAFIIVTGSSQDMLS